MDVENARSDLFLAAAVFVFGGAIVRILLNIVPLDRLPLVAPILAIGLPLATTVLVPFLLSRYRQEPWAMYGLTAPSGFALGTGAALAAPIVVASVLGTASQGGGAVEAFPLIPAGPNGVVALLARVAELGGVAVLGIYVSVKAREAFRGVPRTFRAALVDILRVLAIIAVIAGGLLLVRSLTTGQLVTGLAVVVLPALGVAGTLALATRELPQAGATTRPVLVTPTVIFGLGAFTLQFEPITFLALAYQAALFAALGLVVGLLTQRQPSAFAALTLMLLVAVLSDFGQVIR